MNKQIVVLMLGWVLTAVVLTLWPRQASPQTVQTQPAKTQPARPLLEQAERSIEMANPKLSQVRKKVIGLMITTVAERTFTARDHQELWITLLGVESQYQGTAKSPVGALGIGQLMPQYKADFGKSCGLTDVTKEDLLDDYTNVTLSACYFKQLIEMHGGNVPLAMVGYNCGSHGVCMAAAKVGNKINPETSGYVAKIVIQNERVKKAPKATEVATTKEVK